MSIYLVLQHCDTASVLYLSRHDVQADFGRESDALDHVIAVLLTVLLDNSLVPNFTVRETMVSLGSEMGLDA